MIYSRFKNENVGDKHAKALPEDEWKRVENCHEAIISKEGFWKSSCHAEKEIHVPVSKESMKHIVWLAKWSVVIADTACPILMPDDRSIIVQIII